MSVFLDLTEVKSQSFAQKQIKPGKYWVRCIQAEKKATKAGTGEFLSCKFNFVDEELKGASFFHMFNIKNESVKVQEIGLQQLKSFLEAAGHGLVIENMADLVGLVACAQIGTELYNDKEQVRVKYFLTNKAEAATKTTEESLFS
jgi:hypothetical protein